MADKNIPWIKAQKTTFENWVNQCLRDRKESVTDIKQDFKDGTVLYALYNELTNERIKEIDMKPTFKISCLSNLNIILGRLIEKGIRIVNIQGEDIYECKLKLILGLVWTLIRHFQIIGSDTDSEHQSARSILLDFVNNLVGDPVAKNFKKDWQDGKILSKLVDAIGSGVFPEEERPEDEFELIKKSLDIADEKLGVSKIIDPSYIRDAVDRNSLMTYIGLLKKKYEEKVESELSGELIEKKKIPDNRATGLMVKTMDKDGVPKDANVHVDIKDAEGQSVGDIKTEKAETGVYHVNIDGIENKGDYNVSVKVNRELKESFDVECVSGTQSDLIEGSFTFEVHAVDKNGNKKTTGGDDWDVQITGPEGAVIEVEKRDHGDGRYSAKYYLTAAEDEPSTFKVCAKLDGNHVGSSPFKHEMGPKPSTGQRIRNFFKR